MGKILFGGELSGGDSFRKYTLHNCHIGACVCVRYIRDALFLAPVRRPWQSRVIWDRGPRQSRSGLRVCKDLAEPVRCV